MFSQKKLLDEREMTISGLIELVNLPSTKLRLVDVRTADERNCSKIDLQSIGINCQIEDLHIAISRIDFNNEDKLKIHLKHLPKDDVPTIFYCRGGVRSLKAVEIMIAQGYDANNVKSLQGGIAAWDKRFYGRKLILENHNHFANPEKVNPLGFNF